MYVIVWYLYVIMSNENTMYYYSFKELAGK